MRNVLGKFFCRILFFSLLLFALFIGISPISGHCTDAADYGGDIRAELDDVLDDFGLELGYGSIADISGEDVFAWLVDNVTARMRAPMRVLSAIFLVILFSSVTSSIGVGGMKKSSEGVYRMVCVMAATAVTMPCLTAVYGEVLTALRITGSFILVFVPILTAASAVCGGFTTAGVYHMMMLAASEIIVKLSDAYLLPILGATAALAVTGSVFPNTSLESLSGLLKKTVTWGISVTMTLFTGFVSLKCTISGKADGAAAKTVKMLISGFVPIVGGAVSDAYSTVKGSFDVIGSTVGAAGMIAVAAFILPVLGELLAYRFVMWAGSAAADIFSAEAVSKLLKSIDSGLAIAQSILVCYGVMFILCSAILIQTFR